MSCRFLRFFNSGKLNLSEFEKYLKIDKLNILMKFIADLHLHSKHSRATSKDMDLEHLDEWGKKKGIKVLGTGDFTHPVWLEEIKEKLEPVASGLYKLKNSNSETFFLLSSEISCIYPRRGKVHKIHIVLLAPSFEICEKINAQLGWIGNLKSDGRPILGLDAKELAKIALNVSRDCFIVPAHIWTPWFSLFGSRSGFDSIEECFGEYSKYIQAGETGLSCYDEETEVLINNGWKKFFEVKQNDKICTLNPKTNEVEFQNPIGIFAYDYKGKMYRLQTKRVNLLVTPNHKLFISSCNFRKPPYFYLKKAEDFFNKSKRLKKDGLWKGRNPKYFVLPSVKMKWGCQYYSEGSRTKPAKRILAKSWLKFFGFWLAEGWTNEDKKGHAYNVCLANRDNALLSEMKKILKSSGYNVYWDRKINNVIRVRDYQLFHYLRRFGKSSNKFIPPEIRCLSKELLEIFFEYYIKGDGHRYGRTGKGLSVTTSSVRLRDDLQEIALKIGMSAYYKLHRKKGTPFSSPGQKYKKTYKQSEDSWVIYFIRRNIHTVLPSTIKKYKYTESWVDFNGKVYSLAVPNQVIYVRRNGIPVWCGNSDPPMNWRLSSLDKITLISNSDAHSPRKIGREANVFNTELSYPAIIEAIKSKDPKKFLYTIEFFPQEGKYHFDGHRNCQISLSPQESKKYNNICPTCGKPLTLGVLHRVEELADRPEGFTPNNTIPFKNLIPLEEVIADALGMMTSARKVSEEYKNLIDKFDNEFSVLLDVPFQELEKYTFPEIAESIAKVREGQVDIVPGFDGVFGQIKIFSKGERKNLSKQKTLF